MTIHATTTPLQKKAFARWLSDQLAVRKWSAVEMGNRSALSLTTVRNFLHEKSTPEPVTCKKLAQALSVPVDLVYEKAGYLLPEPDGLSGPKRTLIEMIKNLPDGDAIRLLARSQARMVTQADRKWWA